MRISAKHFGYLLLLTLFAFSNINCGGTQKTIDPDAPRVLKEFPAQGESSTKLTDDEPGKIEVAAQCPADFPVLVECKKWWAETGTAGDNPFLLKGADGATQRQTENACVCDGRHAGKSKDFFGISNHHIKCGVTAVCANK
ncbi:MAG: hypothetical protein OEZ51_02965 [Nitrospinota bacterium]|nr:hypothetical protein [Nitrospinota bacterium]